MPYISRYFAFWRGFCVFMCSYTTEARKARIWAVLRAYTFPRVEARTLPRLLSNFAYLCRTFYLKY